MDGIRYFIVVLPGRLSYFEHMASTSSVYRLSTLSTELPSYMVATLHEYRRTEDRRKSTNSFTYVSHLRTLRLHIFDVNPTVLTPSFGNGLFNTKWFARAHKAVKCLKFWIETAGDCTDHVARLFSSNKL